MLAPKINDKPRKKSVTAALIAGASALASTGISAWNSYAVNRSNSRAVDRQNQSSIQLRDYDNWYNSPVQQMRRLREAGLNPDLVYGSIGAGDSSAPSLAAPSTDIPFDSSAIATSGSSIAGMLQQQDLLDAQVKNINTQTRTQELENLIKEKDLNNWDNKTALEMANLQESVNNAKKQGQLLQEQVNNAILKNQFDMEAFDKQLKQLDEAVRGMKLDNDIKAEDLKVAQNAVRLSVLQIIKAGLENAMLKQTLDYNKKYYEKALDKLDGEIANLVQDRDAKLIANAITNRNFHIEQAKDLVYDKDGRVKSKVANNISGSVRYVTDFVGNIFRFIKF